MYLPEELKNARVLITVKTYPLPSNKYDELVCTAGLLPDGKWIRIYPIPFRDLPYEEQYNKYHWIELDLIRNTSDFRPESYRPRRGSEENIKIQEKIGTKDNWAERKSLVFKEIFMSMNELIGQAKGPEQKSLATLKPAQIIDFVIETDERKWKQEWQNHLLQMNLFDLDEKGQGKKRQVVRKLPYKYSYKLLSEGDKNPRTMMIEDWELGMLYWNCLKQSGGDEVEANRKVQEKYFFNFLKQKELYLFLGTTKQYHRIAPNPFVIIGVFYPPKTQDTAIQLTLF